MEEIINVKEELEQKKSQLRELENDLKNIDKIAMANLDRTLKLKIKAIGSKLEKEKEQLDIKVGNMESLKAQFKEKKTIIKQYLQGDEPLQNKTKQLSKLKIEISNLETSIAAGEKIYEKLDAEKSKKLKVLVKELTSQRKEMIIKLKKDIKLLQQVYDYKLKGKI